MNTCPPDDIRAGRLDAITPVALPPVAPATEAKIREFAAHIRHLAGSGTPPPPPPGGSWRRTIDGEAFAYYEETLSGAQIDCSGLGLGDDDDAAPHATIKQIAVPANWRGRGIGAALLAAVLADADDYEGGRGQRGVTLHLAIGASEGSPLDNDALAAWYGRHGFVRDDPDWPWMTRPAGGARD